MQSVFRGIFKNAERKVHLSKSQQAILRWLRVDDHQAILELDAKNMNLLRYLKQGFQLRTCVFSDAPISLQAEEFNGLECMRGMYDDIPWQNESFHHIVIADFLDKDLETKYDFSEIKRVLKRDGGVYISIPLSSFMYDVFCGGISAFKKLRILLKELENKGFSDVSMRIGGFLHFVLVAK